MYKDSGTGRDGAWQVVSELKYSPNMSYCLDVYGTEYDNKIKCRMVVHKGQSFMY
jgi:hypothetical protein